MHSRSNGLFLRASANHYRSAHMVHNFNAGPSILPHEVFEQASNAILNFEDSGLSILEYGHRTALFEGVMQEAIQLVRDLMQLEKNREVLFLHGGASTQFFQVPMNLLGATQKAAYLDGGTWGVKAIKEARQFGDLLVVGSSKDRNYTYIPKGYDVPEGLSYFHYTTNNTVEGTQMHTIPNVTVPLVADMSSDILSREMDFNRFSLIYAGAQKNIGAAGVNLVVVDPEILGKTDRQIPTMMDYRQHIAQGSMLNTPPVFAVYVCLLTLRWLKKQGGVQAIEKINQAKAELLYTTLDENPIFKPTVDKEDRSLMNVVFVMQDPEMEQEFLALCKQEGMVGVKGHRSVGGFRISLYNALPFSSVQILTDLMKTFALRKG
jgi:phosphoserine aminotransferase